MANDQFPMYKVVPSGSWDIPTGKGISSAQVAALTTYMREVLYDAMGAAVDDARAASSLNSRRGKLFAALKTGRRPRGTGVPSTVSVTFLFRPWMAIHETGGTIRPRAKKYLTVPLPGALRSDGALKRRNPNGWRQFGSFVLTAKSGKKFIVYRSKTSGQLVFLYHLMEKVTLAKRLDLRGAILGKEAEVVAAWSARAMEIFSDIDLYGIAFEGVRIE